jgi:predicted dehydrogenase
MKNIGVIGCGYWGAKHARVLNGLSHVRLHSVADLDKTKVQEIVEKYEGVEGLYNISQLLANPEIDAVVIATPASTHYELTLQALQAGKHVFVEKPITSYPHEAQHLIDVAEQAGLTLMVGHTFEYHPAVEVLRQVVQSSELGDLYYLDAARLNLGLYQRDVNVIHDLSPHDISTMIYVLGQRPVEVSTRGYSMVHGGVVDVAYIEYRFANGFVANSRVSWLAPNKVREMTIVGSQKMVYYDDISETDKIKVFEKYIEPPTETEEFKDWKFSYHYGDVRSVPVPAGEPLQIEVSHFIECVETGCKSRTDGLNGKTVVAILHAAQLSLQNGGRAQPIDYQAQSNKVVSYPKKYSSLGVGATARRAALAVTK